MNIFTLTVLFLLFSQAQLYPKTKLTYEGEVSYEFWGFPRSPSGSNQTKTNNTVELKFQSTLKAGWFKMRVAPRFKTDFSVPSRNRLLIDEAWMQIASTKIKLRLGYQIFNWGMVESQKLVDILNQKDYEDDFLDPDKFGELSARLKFLIAKTTDFELNAELYYLTDFNKALFPSTKGRFNFYNGVSSVSDTPVYGSSKEEWYPQYALRMVATYKTVDLALSYFHGYNRFPSINFVTTVPYYYIIDQGGLELTWVVGKLIVKLESVYRNTTRNDTSRIPAALIPKSYVAYIGGIEYTISQIIDSNDLTFFMEYLGDSDVGKTTVDYRLFQNDIFLGLRYSFNDINAKEMTMGVTVDLEDPEEFFYLVEYTQRFKEVFTFAFRLDGVRSKSGSRAGIFKEELRLKAKITYGFSS